MCCRHPARKLAHVCGVGGLVAWHASKVDILLFRDEPVIINIQHGIKFVEERGTKFPAEPVIDR